jgi:hypothetical protein
VEQMDSTVVIGDGFTARVDALGNLVMEPMVP